MNDETKKDSSTLIPWWKRDGYADGKFGGVGKTCPIHGKVIPKIVFVNTRRGMEERSVCPKCGRRI